MALVRTIKHIDLDKDSPHSEAECTYSIVTAPDGTRLLQLDTYGSAGRKLKREEKPVHSSNIKGHWHFEANSR